MRGLGCAKTCDLAVNNFCNFCNLDNQDCNQLNFNCEKLFPHLEKALSFIRSITDNLSLKRDSADYGRNFLSTILLHKSNLGSFQ